MNVELGCRFEDEIGNQVPASAVAASVSYSYSAAADPGVEVTLSTLTHDGRVYEALLNVKSKSIAKSRAFASTVSFEAALKSPVGGAEQVQLATRVMDLNVTAPVAGLQMSTVSVTAPGTQTTVFDPISGKTWFRVNDGRYADWPGANVICNSTRIGTQSAALPTYKEFAQVVAHGLAKNSEAVSTLLLKDQVFFWGVEYDTDTAWAYQLDLTTSIVDSLRITKDYNSYAPLCVTKTP
ncbi:MAG: hypothetical protein EOP09_10020 [Proteobacteria bacterium]|nr:MAG: hypothetical protein EOP09_10020 [Pseudomonadota bacterium]